MLRRSALASPRRTPRNACFSALTAVRGARRAGRRARVVARALTAQMGDFVFTSFSDVVSRGSRRRSGVGACSFPLAKEAFGGGLSSQRKTRMRESHRSTSVSVFSISLLEETCK